jgi:hypothetical protein
LKRILAALALMASAASLCFGQTSAPAKTGDKRQSAPKPDTRKAVGLVSGIGADFEVRKIGIMAFGNEKTSASIESWGIDAFVAAKAAAILKTNFNVVPIRISKDSLAALDAAPGSLFGDRDGHICNVLRKESQGRPFDYYLWVRSWESPYYNTNQLLRGLGIVHREGLTTGDTYVYALLGVDVLDGKTCNRLRRDLPPYHFSIPGPARAVDKSWMPAAANVPQDARLKELAKTLVEQGLDQTIPNVLAVN